MYELLFQFCRNIWPNIKSRDKRLGRMKVKIENKKSCRERNQLASIMRRTDEK